MKFALNAFFACAFGLFFIQAHAQIPVKNRLKVIPGGKVHILEKGQKIKALVWNIHKADDANWFVDIKELMKDKNLALFQEATYGEDVLELFQHFANYEWSLATSFRMLRSEFAGTGVSTGSRMKSSTQDVLATIVTEPISETPKVSLYNTYPMYVDSKKNKVTDAKNSLLVANVHSINFVTDFSFMIEVVRLEKRLRAHKGPIFLGGDFNTWTQTRINLLNSMARRQGLSPVNFADNERRITLGHPLDHVYFRGMKLTLKENLSYVTSSDHIPLSVEMELQ